MTVERSWRIDYDSPTSPDTYGVIEFEEGQPYTHVGVLVPDNRLQVIADAYRAWVEAQRTWNNGDEEFETLMALLDALTEENSDE